LREIVNGPSSNANGSANVSPGGIGDGAVNGGNANSSSTINSAVLHPNQAELISADDSGCIKVWDLNSVLSKGNGGSMPVVELAGPEETGVECVSVSMSLDGRMLAALYETGALYVWHCKSKEGAVGGFVPFGKVRNAVAEAGYPTKCLFAPNSELIAVLGGGWPVDRGNRHSSGQSDINLALWKVSSKSKPLVICVCVSNVCLCLRV
jgi:WD40 repeat protein